MMTIHVFTTCDSLCQVTFWFTFMDYTCIIIIITKMVTLQDSRLRSLDFSLARVTVLFSWARCKFCSHSSSPNRIYKWVLIIELINYSVSGKMLGRGAICSFL